MRVSCPNCTAEYDLPPAVVARLDGARTVRCARCGTTWAPEPPAAAHVPKEEAPPEASRATVTPAETPAEAARPVPAAAPPVLPEFPPPPVPAPATAVETTPARRTPREGAGDGPRAALAWTLSLAILAGAGWAAWHYRAEIMAAWPPSVRAYAALGLVP